jgi:hypothetical protein
MANLEQREIAAMKTMEALGQWHKPRHMRHQATAMYWKPGVGPVQPYDFTMTGRDGCIKRADMKEWQPFWQPAIQGWCFFSNRWKHEAYMVQTRGGSEFEYLFVNHKQQTKGGPGLYVASAKSLDLVKLAVVCPVPETHHTKGGEFYVWAESNFRRVCDISLYCQVLKELDPSPCASH